VRRLSDALSSNRHIKDGSRILYTHLGGAPALNGYAYSFRNG
jgi:1-aminocyclopropane-1-carboxylate deaminase